jgi:hypothetical protein
MTISPVEAAWRKFWPFNAPAASGVREAFDAGWTACEAAAPKIVLPPARPDTLFPTNKELGE